MCTICSGVNLLVRIVRLLLVGDPYEALYERPAGSGKRVKTNERFNDKTINGSLKKAAEWCARQE
jgi:hypothetical protein